MKAKKKKAATKKRIMILDSKCGESLYEAINDIISLYNLSSKLEVILHNEACPDSLPENFDLYLIHASDTSLEALEAIKKDQPWSKVAVLSGAMVAKPEFIDRWYYIMSTLDLIYLIKEIDIDINWQLEGV